ncbi:MAG TPA: PEGA domain-containing protein, partial [bacterium]|nr:PEGA domain-containing protein [bacterium]
AARAVRLDDQSVSRQHTEINGGPDGWSVRDLGSKNGTSVNGKPIAETVVIGHKDVVKTGIYQLRLITQPTRLEEEMTLPPEIAQADRTVFVAAPPDGMTAEVRKKEISEEIELPPQEPSEEPVEPTAEPASLLRRFLSIDRRRMVIFGGLALMLIAVVAWFASRSLFKPAKPVRTMRPPIAKKAPEPPPEAQGGQQLPGEGQAPPDVAQGAPAGPVPGSPKPSSVPAPAPEPAAPAVQTIPLFLDIASSPLPAKVVFQGKELGITPLRINVELEPDKGYQIEATFDMPEMGQQYVQKVDFTVQKGKSVIPILFRGPIGTIKVMDLPRDVQFYLEGKFSHDRHQEQTAKLNEIVLQKPIYIPYGSYVVELRRARQMGQTSPTYVSDIIYHRSFVIAEDSPSFQMEVNEEDLKVFPVRIRTDPQNAQVFIDGSLVGVSPYEGNFPLGEHKLSIRKEGYFEHSEDLKVDINTPFVADVKLKTSLAGARINNARQAMNRSMYQEAINELAEALASGPAP